MTSSVFTSTNLREYGKRSTSWEAWEPREVGLTPLFVSVPPLGAFLALVKHHSQVMAKLLDPCLTVICGVHGSLECTNRSWAVAHDLSTPLKRFGFQLIKWNYLDNRDIDSQAHKHNIQGLD